MSSGLSAQTLANENRRYFGTGGRSEENAGLGFEPAFRDQDTGSIYRSRFGDGRPAPFHLLDGLPDDVVVRGESGRVTGARASLVAGFVLSGCFFTRAEAAARVSRSPSGVATCQDALRRTMAPLRSPASARSSGTTEEHIKGQRSGRA